MVTPPTTHTRSATTHEVTNQPPPLVGYNLYTADAALAEGVRREGAGYAEEQLRTIGHVAGTPEAIALGFDANEYPPELHTHDRYGHRIDEVSFHPAWHALMRQSVGWGLHATPWSDEQPGAHVARAAGFYLWSQVEAGHGCPISMTYACVPALRVQPELAAEWEPLLTSREYDFGLRPARKKRGAIAGMAMTEKQGGSDVRANTTRAVPIGSSGPGGEYVLTGHKWFCSAPMSDVFLVLAQAPGGLSCFLLPRVLPDGTRNAVAIQRLKDKLGNRSNASCEIELDTAWARMIGEEGRGVRTIVEMVNATRLDCVAGSAALMRQALAQALHHATYRQTFGRTLLDQPLMQNVLADLALESEAATVLFLRLAGAADRAGRDPHEAHLKRLGTAVAKYWVCKRAPVMIGEALECLGGNGFVEESGMPRLYREAPVNSVWEGSGNVNALDVLRAMGKEPEAVAALFAEVRPALSSNRHLREAVASLQRDLADTTAYEVRARRIVEQMALVLQGALLLRYSPPPVAETFCASRLGNDWGRTFGTLAATAPLREILERARPGDDAAHFA